VFSTIILSQPSQLSIIGLKKLSMAKISFIIKLAQSINCMRQQNMNLFIGNVKLITANKQSGAAYGAHFYHIFRIVAQRGFQNMLNK
jgi:hypothetical protein